MRLTLSDQELNLDSIKIMGTLDIQAEDRRTVDDYVALALQMQEQRAELIEVGIAHDNIDVEQELDLVLPIVSRIKQESDLIIAISTSNATVMEQAVANGASIIIDYNALRAENALETVAKLNIPCCLVFDQQRTFAHDEINEPVSYVSEFMFERIDACLNAGIKRSKLLIDPSLGLCTSLEQRLKIIGRLASFKSFALPISMSVPRCIPYHDTNLEENMSVATALSIYLMSEGVNIIRTNKVRELDLALQTWQVLHQSNKPYTLIKAIAQRLNKKK